MNRPRNAGKWSQGRWTDKRAPVGMREGCAGSEGCHQAGPKWLKGLSMGVVKEKLLKKENEPVLGAGDTHSEEGNVYTAWASPAEGRCLAETGGGSIILGVQSSAPRGRNQVEVVHLLEHKQLGLFVF